MGMKAGDDKTLSIRHSEVNKASLGIGSGTLFSAYDSAGGTVVDGTERTVPLGTTRLADSVFSLTAGEVTIGADCWLEISAAATARPVSADGASRGDVELKLQRDGGDSTWVDITGCFARGYTREMAAGSTRHVGTTMSIGAQILQWNAGEAIRMRVWDDEPVAPDQALMAGGSSLTLKVVRFT